jgi:uncharacterized protein
MTGEGRRYAAGVELRLAADELTGAEVLLAAGQPRLAVGRVYFAAFHAARARLFAENLEPKTHAGVQHLFNLTFVKPGKYEASLSQMLARLQKYREDADYSTSFVVDVARVENELGLVREFVGRMQRDVAADGTE